LLTLRTTRKEFLSAREYLNLNNSSSTEEEKRKEILDRSQKSKLGVLGIQVLRSSLKNPANSKASSLIIASRARLFSNWF
jgi:hypothetical protein